MENNLFPTKSNLILAKNTLALSKQGYELLDKKRNLLIREMMSLVDEAAEVQSQINKIFSEAYLVLQRANIMTGIETVRDIADAVQIEDTVNVRFRSIMGVELPVVSSESTGNMPQYGMYRTSSSLDEAHEKFKQVKQLTVKLAEIENSVYRLAINIKKTQKRANALKNNTIPRYESLTKYIQGVLEEKEREDFTRLKVVKKQKNKGNNF